MCVALMPITVRTEMTHVFDAMLFAQRDPDDQERWVFYGYPDDDGGAFFYPRDDAEEVGDLMDVDNLLGINPGDDWDDLTPAQRQGLITFWVNEDA